MDKDKFLADMRTRFKRSSEADQDQRELALDDMRFILGGDHQWDDDSREARRGRPVLTMNKLPKFIRQVTGDQRQNRPSIKVRPVDSGADPMLAKIMEGHIRNIEYNSMAAFAYDNAFKQAVSGGYPGSWRILTDYSDDDSFEQDIIIAPVHNQFTVYYDPETLHHVYHGKLAYCFITETITQETFRRKYPKKEEGGEFDQGAGEELEGWNLDDTRRVAEYFYTEPVTKMVYLLESGETIDDRKVKEFVVEDGMGGKYLDFQDGQPPMPIIRERKVKCNKVMWCKVSGSEILEGPKEWAGKYIPVIPVFGDTWNIAGETHYKSVIRDAKDPQRVYNYMTSQNVEMAALQPKVPYKLTPAQIEGHESQWNQLNQVAYPYVLYNPDPQAPGAPQREISAQTSSAYVQMALQATDDMKDCTGIYDASVGQQSNETSGRAIIARQREGDVGMFEFIDNLTRAIQFTGKCLVDLIPKVYDTERTLRVLGPDETPEMVAVNQKKMTPDGPVLINDITAGKYDVYVTVGPSYTTQRMESAESMMQLIQAVPQLFAVIGDLIVKNLDWPGADEIAERLKSMQQPQQPGAMPGQPLPPELAGGMTQQPLM